MLDPSGVAILLEPDTEVPAFFWKSVRRLEWDWVPLGPRQVRQLVLRPIHYAGFGPGGDVAVSFSEDKEAIVAFDPGRVLVIRDLAGNLVQRNHVLCEQCGYLSGTLIRSEPGTVYDRQNKTYYCVFCRYQWQLRNI